MVPSIAHHLSSANGLQIHVLTLIPITTPHLPNSKTHVSASKLICL